MAQQVGIGYPVKRDILLKQGDILYFVMSGGKFWLSVNEKQITYPRQGRRDNKRPNILWIHRSKRSITPKVC